MITLTHTQRRAGLTMVEVTVGLLSVAVLGVTMGAILYFNYRGWTQMQMVADMQRDGALAMNTLTRVIRGGTATNMLWGGSNTYLSVKDTNNVEGWRFTKTGDRLVYTMRGGAGLDLVRKGVAGFTCNLSSTNVGVWLNLTDSSLNTGLQFTNTIFPRN
jgi:Tfp pilus assembly protein PilW